ncbi:MAG: hypothetical protein QOJ20_1184, partial [Mycobacterium sp.]|nr:hypothetical protein [Mycobacterium sp.]
PQFEFSKLTQPCALKSMRWDIYSSRRVI